jgi:hypothetical protein
MKNNQFNAILAKNDIAREIRFYKNDNEKMNINYIINKLNEIERFTGTANQPSIKSILESKILV